MPALFPARCCQLARNSGWRCLIGRGPVRWASTSTRKWSTPLAQTIAEAINTTGPISIAAYMRQCLTSPNGGYYTSKVAGRDQFGQKGDFVTSPEISQIFGELLGVWIVAEWMAQGRRSSGVELVEVGPGRGTLMDDILRTIRNFKPLASSIEAIYLVEASPTLREAQKHLLCGDRPLEEIAIGYRSYSKYSNVPVTWCEDIRFVPDEADKSPFLVAHEFFDALPIHAFQSVASSPNHIQGLSGPMPVRNSTSSSQTPQWRELVVTPTPTPSNLIIPSGTSTKPPLPDFQLSLAKASTPSSLVLPETSPRYKALKSTNGAIIEISPEARSYAAEFARRIGGASAGHQPNQTLKGSQHLRPTKDQPSGAALIIDYGPASTIPTSTLRGIRSHALVSPFSSPGLVDLSADVDFTALAEAAIEASPGVEVHGPVEQGQWLEWMGIQDRSEMLVSKLDKSDVEGRKSIHSAVQRLVERGGGGMGRLYKMMAIVPEGSGKRRPVGFGGAVEAQ